MRVRIRLFLAIGLLPGLGAAQARMAPLARYLMPVAAEVALARSAAPASVSLDARVLVLAPAGYVEAAHGGNGFTCLVKRSWAMPAANPDFWDAALRSPICFNPAATASVLPQLLFRTERALAGDSAAAIRRALVAARARHALPPPAPGAMCFMMSKQAHLRGRDPLWHPHLIFFAPAAAAPLWGANRAGSPLGADAYPESGLTFLVEPVATWSDGTRDGAPAPNPPTPPPPAGRPTPPWRRSTATCSPAPPTKRRWRAAPRPPPFRRARACSCSGAAATPRPPGAATASCAWSSAAGARRPTIPSSGTRTSARPSASMPPRPRPCCRCT